MFNALEPPYATRPGHTLAFPYHESKKKRRGVHETLAYLACTTYRYFLPFKVSLKTAVC